MKRIFIDVVVESSFAKWQTHKYIPLVDMGWFGQSHSFSLVIGMGVGQNQYCNMQTSLCSSLSLSLIPFSPQFLLSELSLVIATLVSPRYNFSIRKLYITLQSNQEANYVQYTFICQSLLLIINGNARTTTNNNCKKLGL